MTYSPRLGLPLDAALAQALARATRAIGEPGFFDAMLDLLGSACATDSGGAMLFFRDQRPRRLLHRYNATERKLPEDSYLDGPYVLDPHYQRFLQGADSGVYWLRDVAPDDFFDSEYHRLFYSQIGLSDSVDLMWRIDDDAALLFFVERSVRNPPFQPADLAALRLLQPFVEAACAKHHAAATTVRPEMTTPRSPSTAIDPQGGSGLAWGGPARQPGVDTLTHRKVQRTIENFGRSLLTQRERQVLFYMLSGYSSALTAQRLATSEGTIKIHRKNIHRKLDIGSQAELFALFIKCIPFASPEDDAADPLEAYQSKPARR